MSDLSHLRREVIRLEYNLSTLSNQFNRDSAWRAKRDAIKARLKEARAELEGRIPEDGMVSTREPHTPHPFVLPQEANRAMTRRRR